MFAQQYVDLEESNMQSQDDTNANINAMLADLQQLTGAELDSELFNT